MTGLRHALRRFAPETLRRWFAQGRRALSDWARPGPYRFAQTRTDQAQTAGWSLAVEIVQPIRRTAHFEGKWHNIALAAERLNHARLDPGHALSFWTMVGRPGARNGFQTGRGIVDGRLSADIGGGLCQMGSVLYELGLRGGLTVLERHAHTRDLYTEESRFTPFGLDAAVVWGFKDVRLGNPHPFAVALAFAVEGETLKARLWSQAPLAPCPLEVERTERPDRKERVAAVYRLRAGGREPVASTVYVVDVA
jgi:vancomycin resistance protein VanW